MFVPTSVKKTRGIHKSYWGTLNLRFYYLNEHNSYSSMNKVLVPPLGHLGQLPEFGFGLSFNKLSSFLFLFKEKVMEFYGLCTCQVGSKDPCGASLEGFFSLFLVVVTYNVPILSVLMTPLVFYFLFISIKSVCIIVLVKRLWLPPKRI